MGKLSYTLLLAFFTSYIPLLLATPLSLPDKPGLTIGQTIAQNAILYRKLINITSEGYYQVQNFYKTTHKKQSDIFLIKEQSNLSQFQQINVYDLRNMIFDGPLVLWLPNGNKSFEIFFKEGNAEGSIISYYINGNKEIEGQYLAGKPDGLWSFWDMQGELEKKIYYKQGDIQWEKDTVTLKGI